jgi:hypothetical protein
MNLDMSDRIEGLDGGFAAVDLYWIPLGAGSTSCG